MKAAPTGLTRERLLAESPPEIREMAERLCAWVRAEVPGAEERVHGGWRAVGYRDEQAGYFCGTFPRAGEVRFLFEHGASLADPRGMLRGDGRQARYVPVVPGEKIPADALRGLLEEALRPGAIRRR